ncbi:hypothetical protein LTR86_007811 [Recurvomyces mirabilis]|nr:hypothetical protein LTR86_007811 [Recurvomyces mirabilis]
MADAYEASKITRTITVTQEMRAILSWIKIDITKTIKESGACATAALKLVELMEDEDTHSSVSAGPACDCLVTACRKMILGIEDLLDKEKMSKHELSTSVFQINALYESACTDFKAETELMKGLNPVGWDVQMSATEVLECMEAICEIVGGAAQSIEWLQQVLPIA